MSRLGSAFAWAGAAIALAAFAAWPLYVDGGVRAARAAALPAPAPVSADYADRDKEIAFWERAAAEHRRGDMLSPAKLSAEYLQRYRERGDVGDVVRAQHEAELSLRAQPYGNLSAEVALASAFVTLHRFRDALAVTRHVERFDPGDPSTAIREASIDLELGRYAEAGTSVARLRRDSARARSGVDTLAADTLIARYDELTGHLARARERFERATAYANSRFDAPAQQRAWFYVRAGELAFESGDNDAAVAAEDRALEVFPNYSEANRVLARITCALHRWQACLAAARASAQVAPYPEVLGYEVDAQRALGDAAGAAQTDDLIRSVERVGNAQRVSDRLLAIYYAEHGERLENAYRIARRELAVRDDVFTEDTLAWAAATSGRWGEARARSRRALRYGTENALLQYHAGAIAAHAGRRAEAQRLLTRALELNSHFHPFYADDARAELAALAARP